MCLCLCERRTGTGVSVFEGVPEVEEVVGAQEVAKVDENPRR